MVYNELISQAKELAACPMSLHVALQVVFSHIHVYGETVRSFISSLSSLGSKHFPYASDFEIKLRNFWYSSNGRVKQS